MEDVTAVGFLGESLKDVKHAVPLAMAFFIALFRPTWKAVRNQTENRWLPLLAMSVVIGFGCSTGTEQKPALGVVISLIALLALWTVMLCCSRKTLRKSGRNMGGAAS